MTHHLSRISVGHGERACREVALMKLVRRGCKHADEERGYVCHAAGDGDCEGTIWNTFAPAVGVVMFCWWRLCCLCYLCCRGAFAAGAVARGGAKRWWRRCGEGWVHELASVHVVAPPCGLVGRRGLCSGHKATKDQDEEELAKCRHRGPARPTHCVGLHLWGSGSMLAEAEP